MSSPGQKRGSCGHAMASFEEHSYSARCRDKGKGEEPCISNKETTDCKFCNVLTPEQRTQLATPSYKLKKEKQEAKRTDSNPTDDGSLVDPASVSVIGVVGDSSGAQASSAPPEKKPKKAKAPAKVKKSVESSSTDSKISQLDEKWSERFNRLEILLLSKSFQPTFSSEVCVTPTHSPPSGIAKDSEPFFQPTNRPVDISPVKRTGPDTDAALQRSAGKLHPDRDSQEQVSTESTGPDRHALQHQSAGKLKSDVHRPRPSLDNLLPWSETISAHLWWQNPANVMKGADLHPKDHSIQIFTDASNKGWGAHLEQVSIKGLWSDREKRLHINVLELKAVSLALKRFKDQCPNSVGCYRQQ